MNDPITLYYLLHWNLVLFSIKELLKGLFLRISYNICFCYITSRHICFCCIKKLLLKCFGDNNWHSILIAMAGGIALSLGNLATRYAWAFVGYQHNLELLLDGKINKAEILFPGVTCFLIAVCLGSAVHSSNAAGNKVKLQSLSDDLEDGSGSSTKAKAGTADFVVELENRRSIKVKRSSSLACLYFIFFYFSVSCFIIAIILNIIFLYHLILNLPKTTFRAYLNEWNGKGWAFLANLLCGFGNGLQFMGGQAAGTFWGIFLFGEYKKSSRITYILLVSMLSMFIVAVGILMASSGHRKSSSD
ncbi:hypothetical protein UlMin_004364 [Ulmus minor]